MTSPTPTIEEQLDQILIDVIAKHIDTGDGFIWRNDIKTLASFKKAKDELTLLITKARMEQIQQDSNKCVELGHPVLDYNTKDNFTELGRYFDSEYQRLKATKQDISNE